MRRGPAAVLAALVFAAASATGAEAAGFSRQDLRIPASDGVELAATLYEPGESAPAAGRPAIMLLHGLGQTRRSFETGANGVALDRLLSAGYSILTYDARAHGESGGLFTLDGPREVEDVRNLFEWLAARPGIDRARIGAFGVSYGGGALLLAAAAGVPFAAIVPAATWSDLARALFPQGLTKTGVVAGLLASVAPERVDPVVQGLREDLIRSRNLNALTAFTAARSTRGMFDRFAVPTFWLQGRRDFFVDFAQASAAFAALRGPKRLFLGDLGHTPATNPPQELAHVAEEVQFWFDRFLKGTPNGIDTRPPVEVAPDPWHGRAFEYPGLPAVRRLTFRLPGKRAIRASGRVIRSVSLPRRRLETFGAAEVRVTASTTRSWPHLVAVLSVVRPGRGESVVSAGGAATRPARRPRTFTIRLLSEASPIPRGSRLRLTLASTSAPQSPLYLIGVPAASRITIGTVTLTVRVLQRTIST